MKSAKVTCCHCGDAFDERALAGPWLDRRCPLCGKRLSEEAYDSAAANAVARHRTAPGGKARKRLDDLARARYYTSEWFRLACAGQGSTAPDAGLFGLRPVYGADGSFELVPEGTDRAPEGGLGVSAEYFVFDALRAEIARAGSPLEGAALVPHRNRLCRMHVFIDPASFVSDCDEFRQRTYIGFWCGSQDNVFAALEALEARGEPIMSQRELDRRASALY